MGIRNIQQWDPKELDLVVSGGINAVDLKAVATTKYATGVLKLTNHFNIQAIIKVVNVGTAATVGDFKLTVKLYDKGDKNFKNHTAIYEFDLATLLSSLVTNDVAIIFGAGNGAAKRGTATLDVDTDAIKVFQFIELILEVTTASDAGTSSVATMHLLADK